MQSGVAAKMGIDPSETTPKQLRVGVNSAMVETSTIVGILIDKGIITMEEWTEKLTLGMNQEAERYEKELSNSNINIKLG
jgi:hypothetical protein